MVEGGGGGGVGVVGGEAVADYRASLMETASGKPS